MIKVHKQPEYESFDQEVRQPGATFLRTNPHPTNKEFRGHEYWGRARTELQAAYSQICAYTASYLSTGGSLDHFIPKSKMHSLAYEWDNFRLSDQRVNNWKKNSLIAVDPFEIENGWLYLDLPTCIVKVDRNISKVLKSRLKQTIELLRLNRDESLISHRFHVLESLVSGLIDIDYVRNFYPFIGREVDMRGGVAAIAPLFEN